MAMFRNVNLAPIAASGFERAGAAYGQMFQNLGNTIAQNVETKRIKKEEKQRNQATANFILKNTLLQNLILQKKEQNSSKNYMMTFGEEKNLSLTMREIIGL